MGPSNLLLYQFKSMVNDSKYSDFKIILEFLYTGKLPIDSSSVFEVMHAAQSLNLSQAVDICKEFMDDFGVPVTIDESIETTESFIDIKESLLNAEKNIQNVESVLDI